MECLIQRVVITDKDIKWCMKHYPQYSHNCEFIFIKQDKPKKWRRNHDK